MASANTAFEMPPLITTVPTIETARALPKGSVVGDMYGGLTFNDAISAVLEARSFGGWSEVIVAGQSWTIIVLNR